MGVLGASPVLALPQAIDNNARQTIAQSSSSNQETTRELGKFPQKGNENDWIQAVKLTKNTNELRKSNNCQEAIREASAAIALYSYDANIYLDRALSYYQLGVEAENAGDLDAKVKFLQSSILDYKKALELNNDWRLHGGLSRSFVHLGLLNEAAKSANDALYHSSPAPPTNQVDVLARLITSINKRIAEQSKK